MTTPDSTARSDSALHTPGPWEWETGCLDRLLSPHGPVIDGADYEGSWLSGRTEAEQEANALLIAAAPELLTQLQYAVKLLGAFPALNATAQVQSMRDTLAKATPQNHLQHKG